MLVILQAPLGYKTNKKLIFREIILSMELVLISYTSMIANNNTQVYCANIGKPFGKDNIPEGKQMVLQIA